MSIKFKRHKMPSICSYECYFYDKYGNILNSSADKKPTVQRITKSDTKPEDSKNTTVSEADLEQQIDNLSNEKNNLTSDSKSNKQNEEVTDSASKENEKSSDKQTKNLEKSTYNTKGKVKAEDKAQK